jgi:Protein of unknown function (DUF1194)
MVAAAPRGMSENHAWHSIGINLRISGATIQCLSLGLLLTAYISSYARGAQPSPHAVQTDANVVTAIDVSDSIGRYEEWLEQTGLVRGLVHPGFLRAATAGPHRRIGFAAFTWSSDGKFDLLVPWTIIGSAEEAARISAALASITLIDRSHYGGGDREDAREDENDVVRPERLTDISAAIDFASLLLASVPYATSRSVMNICGNGTDNVDDGTVLARHRALARGFTINGLVLGRKPEVTQYFRSSVIGGPGSFVMELSDPNDAGEIMMKKFSRDLVSSLRTIKPRSDREDRVSVHEQ